MWKECKECKECIEATEKQQSRRKTINQTYLRFAPKQSLVDSKRYSLLQQFSFCMIAKCFHTADLVPLKHLPCSNLVRVGGQAQIIRCSCTWEALFDAVSAVKKKCAVTVWFIVKQFHTYLAQLPYITSYVFTAISSTLRWDFSQTVILYLNLTFTNFYPSGIFLK